MIKFPLFLILWINFTKFQFCLKDLQLKQKIKQICPENFEKELPNYDKNFGMGTEGRAFFCFIIQGKGY